jgi:hypothetical protein
VDDLLAPLGRRIDPALVDPKRDPGRTQFAGQVEHAFLIGAGVAYEDICRGCH